MHRVLAPEPFEIRPDGVGLEEPGLGNIDVRERNRIGVGNIGGDRRFYGSMTHGRLPFFWAALWAQRSAIAIYDSVLGVNPPNNAAGESGIPQAVLNLP